jgi:hypothetical protein
MNNEFGYPAFPLTDAVTVPGNKLREMQAAITAKDSEIADLKESLRVSQQSEKEAWRYLPEVKDEVATLRQQLEGHRIDEQFAQKLAMELECMLLDPVGYWDKAAKVLGDYRDAWEKISPTPLSFMGEPMPAERRAIFATMKEKREAAKKDKS